MLSFLDLDLATSFIFGTALGSMVLIFFNKIFFGDPICREDVLCPVCGHPILYYDAIPIVSWLALKGSCRHCNAKITPLHPFIEAASGAFSAATLPSGGYLALASFLVSLFLGLSATELVRRAGKENAFFLFP